MFQVAASSWWLSVGVDKDVNAPIRYGRHRLYHFRPFAQNSGSVFVVLRPQLIIIIKCIFCEKRKRRNNDYTVQVSKSDSIKRLPRRSTAECFAGAVLRWLTSNLQTRWLLLASSRDCLLFFSFLFFFLPTSFALLWTACTPTSSFKDASHPLKEVHCQRSGIVAPVVFV